MFKKVKLSDLGDIYTGNTPSKNNKDFYNSNDIMFIKPDILSYNIKNIENSNEYISEKARKKARIIPKNSLLVSCIGNIGKLGINNKPVAFNQQINAIVHNDKIESSKYLAYVLKFNQKKLKSIANAPVVPIINKNEFSKFEVYIHDDWNIQKRIVDILDKAVVLIQKRQEEIRYLDDLIKSKFIEMFGDPVSNPKKWNKNKLDEVVTNDCTISYGIVQTGEEQKEGIPVIRPIDIVNNKQPILEELKKTTQEISNKHKKTILRGNELLITVRANIGDVCLIDNQFKGCNVGRGITPIRLKEDLINGYFLKHQFKTYGCQRELKTLAKGITLVQLNMEDLRKFKLIVPPIELQNEFADFVKETDKLKYQKLIISLKVLTNGFNSLIQEMLNSKSCMFGEICLKKDVGRVYNKSIEYSEKIKRGYKNGKF